MTRKQKTLTATGVIGAALILLYYKRRHQSLVTEKIKDDVKDNESITTCESISLDDPEEEPEAERTPESTTNSPTDVVETHKDKSEPCTLEEKSKIDTDIYETYGDFLLLDPVGIRSNTPLRVR